MSQIYVNGRSYHQQFRKCSNPGCRCVDGDLSSGENCHGPYWYAGSDYIGKNLPAWVTNHLALLEAEKDNLSKLKQEIAERIDHHRRELQRAEGEQAAINALQKGQWVDQRILKLLQLEKFSVNGHK
jgi:hypothetical protein